MQLQKLSTGIEAARLSSTIKKQKGRRTHRLRRSSFSSTTPSSSPRLRWSVQVEKGRADERSVSMGVGHEAMNANRQAGAADARTGHTHRDNAGERVTQRRAGKANKCKADGAQQATGLRARNAGTRTEVLRRLHDLDEELHKLHNGARKRSKGVSTKNCTNSQRVRRRSAQTAHNRGEQHTERSRGVSSERAAIAGQPDQMRTTGKHRKTKQRSE